MDWKRVACPDTRCSIRPQTCSCATAASACTWTTKARCMGKGQWDRAIVGAYSLLERRCSWLVKRILVTLVQPYPKGVRKDVRGRSIPFDCVLPGKDTYVEQEGQVVFGPFRLDLPAGRLWR